MNVNPFKHPIVVSSTNRRWSTFNALKPTATSEYSSRFFFFSLLVSYSWISRLVHFPFSILRVSICHFLRDSILFAFYRFRIVFVILIRVAVEIGEQEVEEHRVWQNYDERPFWVVTVVNEQLAAVQKRQAELTLFNIMRSVYCIYLYEWNHGIYGYLENSE